MIRAVVMSAAIACIAMLATSVRAFERADVRGLSLEVEQISETVRVDGVPMRIERAGGRDALLLAQRIERRWRTEAGKVSNLRQSGWQMVVRWHEGRSELIQWRESNGIPELLYSIVDITQSARLVSPPPFSLPGRCEWGRVIEGAAAQQRFAQHSAYCRMRRLSLPDALRPHLHSQGWIIRRDTSAALDLEREGQRGVLLLSDAGVDTALTWLGLRSLDGAHP